MQACDKVLSQTPVLREDRMKPSRRLPEHTSSRDCWCEPRADEPSVWVHRDLEKSAAVCEGELAQKIEKPASVSEGDLISPDPPHPDRGFPV